MFCPRGKGGRGRGPLRWETCVLGRPLGSGPLGFLGLLGRGRKLALDFELKLSPGAATARPRGEHPLGNLQTAAPDELGQVVVFDGEDLRMLELSGGENLKVAAQLDKSLDRLGRAAERPGQILRLRLGGQAVIVLGI